MDKTILDFTEATEFAADDWIIFDSESGGGCRIKAKQIEPRIYGIEVTYTQTQEVYPDTPLNDLRQDLVVKAIYTKGRKKEVEDYTLSGTLTVGTSNITVSYHGYDEIIQVVVTKNITYLYNWDFTQSLTDKKQGLTAVLSQCTRTDNGIVMNNSNGEIRLFSSINLIEKTVEIDFTELSHLNNGMDWLIDASSNQIRGFWYGYNYGQIWKARDGSDKTYTVSNNVSSFSNITMKFVFTSEHLSVTYNENVLYEGGSFAPNSSIPFIIGRSIYSYGHMTVTGARVYANEEVQ